MASFRPIGVSIVSATAFQGQADGSRMTIEYRPPREGEVRRGGLDPSRAADWLGWRPEVDLRDGLGQTYDHFRAAAGTPG